MIRVENIIRTDINTELMEILELYCELLLARTGLLEGKECDAGLEEAVKSIIYAAPRTEIKELQQVRQLLVEKYGKEFALEAIDNTDGKVADRVLRKLRVEPPSRELVLSYLTEIARTYGVDWPRRKDEDGGDDDGGGGGGGRQKSGLGDLEPPLLADVDVTTTTTTTTKEEELSRATPPRSSTRTTGISVAPPSPSSDNINPKLKLPDTPELKPGGKGMSDVDGGKKSAGGGGGSKAVVGGTIPDADELAARFAALKRKT